jgi:hypothetical protein
MQQALPFEGQAKMVFLNHAVGWHVFFWYILLIINVCKMLLVTNKINEELGRLKIIM